MTFPETHSIEALLELPESLPPLTAGLIPEVGVGLVVAQPKTFKTTTLLHLSLVLAAGGKAFDAVPVSPSPVLNVLLEGTPHAASNRLRRMGATRGLPLTLCMDRSIAGNTEALDKLVAFHRPRLVVLDTMRKFFPKMKIEDANSVSDHFFPLHEIAHKYNTFIYCAHHCNKQDVDGAEGILGSNAFYAEPDALLYLSKVIKKDGSPIEREIILHGEFRDYEGLEKTRLHFNKDTLIPQIKPESRVQLVKPHSTRATKDSSTLETRHDVSAEGP